MTNEVRLDDDERWNICHLLMDAIASKPQHPDRPMWRALLAKMAGVDRVVFAAIADPDGVYEIAKQITLNAGYSWTDPRTRETHQPPKASK